MRVLFVLPGGGGGGGAHSVVQEAHGLHRLGAEVGVATTAGTLDGFLATYPEMLAGPVALHGFDGAGDLGDIARGYDLVSATTWRSAHLVAEVKARLGAAAPKAAYYIQDYEPLFNIPHTPEWEESRASYTVIPDAQLFAKTRFLCDIVTANHHRPVAKVAPSIDHETYHPGRRMGGEGAGRLRISAMLRPLTPRRAPHRTARILEMIAQAFPDQVELVVFGCAQADLDEVGIRLSPTIDNRGPLSRAGVANVLRQTDLFLDLSDFQAFGRTGLEGMACGCVPIVPLLGGSDEYLRHWINGFRVDTRSDAEVMAAVAAYVGLRPAAREGMRRAAISTALDYTVDKAAYSEYVLFSQLLA
jgi:glycosyltransferase involved in cell wall biosynthesis